MPKKKKDPLTMLEEIVKHSANYTEAVYFDADESTGELRVEIHVPNRGAFSITAEGNSAKEAILFAHHKLFPHG